MICKKELKSYFASPIAYILMAFFGLIFGFGFYTATRDMIRYSFQAQMMGQQQPMNVNDQIIRPLLGFASTIALFLIPMITMRLYAEEKRSGTMELLLTSPVRDVEIILGKFLASLIMYGCMIGVSALDVAALFAYGAWRLEPWSVACAVGFTVLVQVPLWQPEMPDDLWLDEPARALCFAGVGRKDARRARRAAATPPSPA